MEVLISVAKNGLDVSVKKELQRSHDGLVSLADRPILVRVASRDSEAFDACIEQYGNLIWSIAKRFSPSQADAEDAVQEIFIEVWSKAEKFDPKRSCESTFITMVARRKLIDRHRKLGRSLETVSIGNELEAFDLQEPVDSLDLIEEAAKASRCLENLNSSQQDVLRRSIHHGLSHTKIATDLALPLGSVKSLARRGLIQLRECMERFTTGPKVEVSS